MKSSVSRQRRSKRKTNSSRVRWRCFGLTPWKVPRSQVFRFPKTVVRPAQHVARLATVTALARAVVGSEFAERHVRAPSVGEDGALLGLDRGVDKRREGGRRRAGNHGETHRAGRSGAPLAP